jgi:hypothetical protein
MLPSRCPGDADPPPLHTAIDYLYAAVFLAAPALFDLSGIASLLCYVAAAVYALPDGGRGGSPRPEALMALLLAAVPWASTLPGIDASRPLFLSAAVLLAAGSVSARAAAAMGQRSSSTVTDKGGKTWMDSEPACAIG